MASVNLKAPTLPGVLTHVNLCRFRLRFNASNEPSAVPQLDVVSVHQMLCSFKRVVIVIAFDHGRRASDVVRFGNCIKTIGGHGTPLEKAPPRGATRCGASTLQKGLGALCRMPEN
jgi:hypothetical protein